MKSLDRTRSWHDSHLLNKNTALSQRLSEIRCILTVMDWSLHSGLVALKSGSRAQAFSSVDIPRGPCPEKRSPGRLVPCTQLPVWNEYLSSFSWHSGSPFQITTVICLFKKKIKKIQLWLHKLKLFKHTYRSIAGLLIICFLCDGAAASCTEATRHVSLPKQLFLMLVPVTAKQS